MLIGMDGLADLLGERHRIITNDWQAAHMNTLTSRLLDRAADILEQIDFTHKGPARRPRRPEDLTRAPVLRGRAEVPGRRSV